MKKDLAEIHDFITDIFRWPGNEEEFNRYKLTNEQLTFYKENGYIAGIQVLNSEQINLLESELHEFIQPGYSNDLFYEFNSNESLDSTRTLFHALGAWRISKGFHDILWNPAVVIPASQLLGDASVRFWHDQIFYKPAKHGGVVAWHQDYSYWTRTVPMNHLTCWFSLDDSDRNNGCLHYVPKSHKWGFLDKVNLGGNMDDLTNYLTDEQKELFKPIQIELKKGFATFHHPLLVHGSFENSSERPRRALVLNFFEDGTKSDSDELILDTTHIISKGQKMEGQFYPLLYSKV